MTYQPNDPRRFGIASDIRDETTHCANCKNHTFQGLENYCKKHKRAIERKKWLKKNDNGEWICKCGDFKNRYTKCV